MNIQSTSNPEIVEVKVFANGNVKEEVNDEDGQFSQLVDQILEKNTFVEFNFTISSKGRELLRRDGFEFRFEGDSKIEEGKEGFFLVLLMGWSPSFVDIKFVELAWA